MMFLVLVCAQNSHGHCSSCLQSSFTYIVKKYWSPSSFADPESCHNQLNLGAAATRQQDASPWGRAGALFPGWNVVSQTILQIVRINNPLVPKTDTQETENLDKAISLDQEGASMCSLLLSKHKSTKWLTVGPPYIPDALVPGLTWDLSRSKVHNLPRLAKRLEGWVRAYSW
jgi:hypothetical protein